MRLGIRSFSASRGSTLPSGCIRGAPFPAGLHRRQSAAANLDKTQERRVSRDSSSTAERRSNIAEERRKSRRRTKGTSIVLKYVCFYLVCADICRYFKDIAYGTDRRLHSGLDKKKLITNKVGRAVVVSLARKRKLFLFPRIDLSFVPTRISSFCGASRGDCGGAGDAEIATGGGGRKVKI